MKLTIKLLVPLFPLLLLANIAKAETPREQLNQMVKQLQTSPNDNTLREKIIKLSTSIKPTPEIPEEARRSFVRGNTAFSEAKGPDDYARAVQRYEEVLVIAPWWGDAYFNLAKALEMRQEYSRAIQTIKLFILTGPAADDVRKAQDYSYALEDRQEKSTKEKTDKESAARAEFADPKTRLIWRRCAEGMAYSDGTCTGTASKFTYEEALQHARSEAKRTGASWRVPERGELRTVIDRKYKPAMIDPSAFPATPAGLFWVASSDIAYPGIAWGVNFDVGYVAAKRLAGSGSDVNKYFNTESFYVRLVRAD